MGKQLIRNKLRVSEVLNLLRVLRGTPGVMQCAGHGDQQDAQERSAPQEPPATLDAQKSQLSTLWNDAAKWPSTSTIALVLLLLSLLVTAYGLDRSYIMTWMLWMREHERQGRIWFVVAYVTCLLLLLPASVLALLAGVTPQLAE